MTQDYDDAIIIIINSKGNVDVRLIGCPCRYFSSLLLFVILTTNNVLWNP